MSLTASEKRGVKYKLERADHDQALEFLDTLGFNPTADKIFEKMWSERQPSCTICGDGADKIKYGKTPEGIQRYKCKECGETFSERTNMPFHDSAHSVSKWKAFFERMVKGDTLTELSRQFNIARTTAHEWRHQLLSILRHIQGEKWLAGRIWADETKVPINNIGRDQPKATGHYSVMTIKDSLCYSNDLVLRS